MTIQLQPIETAPRDGTRIIGVIVLNNDAYLYEIYWRDGWHDWGTRKEIHCEYWHPLDYELPPKPKTVIEEVEERGGDPVKIIKVYGASDDLIEIEGGIEDELSHYDSGPFYLHFSDGLLVRGEYADDGCWHFSPINFTPKKHFIATDSDSREYSDVLEFESNAKTVKLRRLK